MGNLCFKNEEINASSEMQNDKPNFTTRKKLMTTLKESDIVIAKLKIQKDRLETRISNLEKKEQGFHKEALKHARNKDKERALYAIRQRKRIKDFKEQTRTKMEFIDKQIFNIEQAEDDVEFTNTLKQSNQALKKLHEEIDTEEIEIAKELQEEGRILKEDLEDMLREDNDDELLEELNIIEARMVDDNFDDDDIELDIGTQQNGIIEQKPNKQVLLN